MFHPSFHHQYNIKSSISVLVKNTNNSIFKRVTRRQIYHPNLGMCRGKQKSDKRSIQGDLEKEFLTSIWHYFSRLAITFDIPID